MLCDRRKNKKQNKNTQFIKVSLTKNSKNTQIWYFVVKEKLHARNSSKHQLWSALGDRTLVLTIATVAESLPRKQGVRH